MRDRAGQVYLLLGGLLFGVATTAISVGTGTTWLIAWSIVGALALYLALGALFEWPLPARKSRLANAVANAQALAAEIAEFAAEERIRSGMERPSADAWDRDVDRMLAHSAHFMGAWTRRFGVRAVATYDLLVALGAAEPSRGRMCVEDPANPLGVEEASRVIGAMAAEIEVKHLM